MCASERSQLATTVTVSRQFRGQLGNLMQTLRSTEPHYIKCIKPNNVKAPGGFSPHLVRQQLNYRYGTNNEDLAWRCNPRTKLCPRQQLNHRCDTHHHLHTRFTLHLRFKQLSEWRLGADQVSARRRSPVSVPAAHHLTCAVVACASVSLSTCYYSGVLEVVRIRREAYPVRIPFQEFYDR